MLRTYQINMCILISQKGDSVLRSLALIRKVVFALIEHQC